LRTGASSVVRSDSQTPATRSKCPPTLTCGAPPRAGPAGDHHALALLSSHIVHPHDKTRSPPGCRVACVWRKARSLRQGRIMSGDEQVKFPPLPGRVRISPVRGPLVSRWRLLVMPSAFRHSAVMMNRVRRSGPPSINANSARFWRSSTRCRTSPPSATRTIEYPPVETQTAPSASRQVPSGPTAHTTPDRLATVPVGRMAVCAAREYSLCRAGFRSSS
jgi:hypothetical protein